MRGSGECKARVAARRSVSSGLVFGTCGAVGFVITAFRPGSAYLAVALVSAAVLLFGAVRVVIGLREMGRSDEN